MNDLKWYGWAAFGGFVMIFVGIFQMISGVIALFNSDWLVRGFTGTYFVSLTSLGWWWILVGALLTGAGFGILSGSTWARIVGVICVGLNAVAQLMYMPIYPLWALTVFILDMVVCYAIIAYPAAEVRAMRQEEKQMRQVG